MAEWVQFCGFTKFCFGYKIEDFESRFKKVEQGGDLAFRKKNLLTKMMGLDVRSCWGFQMGNNSVVFKSKETEKLASLEEIS